VNEKYLKLIEIAKVLKERNMEINVEVRMTV